jgi:hypothetical protein
MSFLSLTAVAKTRSKSVIAGTRLREAGPASKFENIDCRADTAEIKQLPLLLPPLLPPLLLETVLAGGAALAPQASAKLSTTLTQTAFEKPLSTPSVL